MKKKILFLCSVLIASSCTDLKENHPLTDESEKVIQWYHKDFQLDSLAGISLEKAYEELIDENTGKEVIVAIIDSQVAIYHEDLADCLYVNPDEIIENGVDDDNNGYADDINGWNFLGYGTYQSLEYALEDHTRTVKRMFKRFNGKEKSEIATIDKNEYLQFQYAIKLRQESIVESELLLEAAKKYREIYFRFKELFADRLPHYDGYTLKQLDSVKVNNEEEEKLVQYLKLFTTVGLDLKTLDLQEKQALVKKYTSNNLNYNDREDIGDDPNDYDDNCYGNNNLNALQERPHGTQVSGIIAAKRNNYKGIAGVSDKIKLMILPISPLRGEYSDKDFFYAVKYATDNGAKVINFSNGKHYSDNPHLLFNALRYAENNDVLVVTSAGNSGKNLDLDGENEYPKDKSPEGDTVENLIKVGASSQHLDTLVYASFSNYGKETVDLFAPGTDMRTTTTFESKYQDHVEGTSLSSALTSGVAALLYSHYPNLTSIQVKQILMESGSDFNTILKIPGKESISFKNLSKSGKILNAYNALKMAQEISKN